MKITDVKTIQLTRPLDRPMRNAQSSVDRRVFTLVIVETDSGLTGLGDAFGDPAITSEIVRRRYGPMAVGLDPLDIDGLWRKLYGSRAFWELGGSALCAISAIEVACWDLRGKAEGVAVSELLGGAKRSSLEAYASDLHWEEPERMAALAARDVDNGFGYVKTHIGAPGEEQRDLQRLELIRAAIGKETKFMVDINTGFDRPTALARGREMADFDLFWYEEPLWPQDHDGHAQLRAQLPMKIATGENLYTEWGFRPLLEKGGCDFVMPDILRCGGIEQTRRVCLEAHSHNVVPSPHNYSSGVGLAATLHLMAAVEETQLLEFDTTGSAIYEELFVEPLVVSDGMVSVPTSPGLGVELTDEIVDRWS